jgi:tripartite-type tricarboxylate transporter receptor subunit TctC
MPHASGATVGPARQHNASGGFKARHAFVSTSRRRSLQVRRTYFHRFAVVMLVAAALCAPIAVDAQSYPSRAVRIIVPFSPGSGGDVLARMLAPKFTAAWKQPVIIENRDGGGGLIGAELVAKAAPDGYTLLLAASSWSVAPSLYAKPPYEPLRDFVAIGRICFIPSVLVVSPALQVNDVKDLIRLAKAKPGQLDYSSSGKGTSSFLSMEYFKAMAGVDILEVPYKGTAQALTDVIGGQVTMNMPNLASALPQIRAGRVKALAVTTAKRSTAVPDIPTIAESAGLANYDAAQWQGLVAPAGTPPDIVARINAELNRALHDPDIVEKTAQLGIELAPTTPGQFGNDIAADVAKWSQLIKTLNMRLD